jgi:hypothetical protein
MTTTLSLTEHQDPTCGFPVSRQKSPVFLGTGNSRKRCDVAPPPAVGKGTKRAVIANSLLNSLFTVVHRALPDLQRMKQWWSLFLVSCVTLRLKREVTGSRIAPSGMPCVKRRNKTTAPYALSLRSGMVRFVCNGGPFRLPSLPFSIPARARIRAHSPSPASLRAGAPARR